jgi:hypothetical protein
MIAAGFPRQGAFVAATARACNDPVVDAGEPPEQRHPFQAEEIRQWVLVDHAVVAAFSACL